MQSADFESSLLSSSHSSKEDEEGENDIVENLYILLNPKYKKEPKASGIELSMEMRVELPPVALTCDKTSVSHRAASLIASVVSKDFD
ncbi:hypothetical protein HHI36_006363 [Cryptolaemus montrouzieri]|uniref:Uncharacterized protein n=1 Tax=Cryptolaemus montrouzieri TaxID=559131 RepID=A0ABD2NX87_9CUCU